MAVEKKSAPYAPPSNVIALIRRYRERNLPDVVDIELLQDVNIPKGNVHRTLAALEFLGLLSADGFPTSAFHSIQISTDEEYRQILEGLVRSAYREVFQIIDPVKDSQSVIDNHFRRYQPTSQRSRMVTLFLALCREAGVATLDVPRERSSKAAPSSQRGKASQTRPKSTTDATNGQTVRSPAASQPMTIPSMTELRRTYIAALIEQIRQPGALNQEMATELLERIERLLAEAGSLEELEEGDE